MDTKKQYKVAVVGPKDLVFGFKALGATVMPAQDSNQALEVIAEAREQTISGGEEKFAVIMVTAGLAQGISDDDYKKITRGALPAVVVIPDLVSEKEAGERKLKELTEKAIGSDILK